MRALLLDPADDLDASAPLPPGAETLEADLGLPALVDAMAGDEAGTRRVARHVLLSAGSGREVTILHRQSILRDVLANPEAVRALHRLAAKGAGVDQRAHLGVFGHYPASILHAAIEVMRQHLQLFRQLRELAATHAASFHSAGFGALFAMFTRELDDAYLAEVEERLDELELRRGVLMSVGLGAGNALVGHVLLREAGRRPPWLRRLLGEAPPAYVFHIAERDEAGARALSDLRERAIDGVAHALAQAADHVGGFFAMLRDELAFYVGALALHGRLRGRVGAVCLPAIEPAGSRRHAFVGLCDVGLALTSGRAPVGNAVDLHGRDLVLVTGPNQGGKTSFLRAVGLAQLMAQAGLFVTAESFETELCSSLFTHFKREEDARMRTGKLAEELERMSHIADHLRPGAWVLFNEPFASTDEREGSELAAQVIAALLERRHKAFVVTHLHELARDLQQRSGSEALFLRAERLADGTRTFRLAPGAPRSTSHGEDLFHQVFEGDGPRHAAG